MFKSFQGKRIVNFGDSIFGNFRAPEDISTYLAQRTGASVFNVGFGGCRMSEHPHPLFDRFCMYRLAHAVTARDFSLQSASFSDKHTGDELPGYFKDTLARLASIDFTTVDIVTIAYGTNDFTGGRMPDGTNTFDTGTFGGALRYSLEKLKKTFPHMQLAVCSPTYRFFRDNNGKVIGDSNDTRYPNGTLLDFVAKTEEIAKEYNILYIDNYHDCGICAENRDQYFSAYDGTHPLPCGRKRIAENLAKALEKY